MEYINILSKYLKFVIINYTTVIDMSNNAISIL